MLATVFSSAYNYMQLASVAQRASEFRLWGHMKALFPLLFSSRFLRGVFMIFRLPGGTPNGAPGGKGRTSGTVGILHFSVLEEVIMWVLARFSKWRAGAPR